MDVQRTAGAPGLAPEDLEDLEGTAPVDATPPATAPPAPSPAPSPGLLEGLREGVVVCDRDGIVRSANSAARELLPRLRVGEVVEAARCPALTRAVRGGGPRDFEIVVGTAVGARHLGGRRGPVLERSSPPVPPLGEGDSCWYLHDVTGEHRRADTLLAAQERAAFLAEAGRALHGVLHLDRTARRAAALAVPRLGAEATLVVGHDDTLTWAHVAPGGGRPRVGHRPAKDLARVPGLAGALAGEAGGDPWLGEELATLTRGEIAGAEPLRACPVPTTGVVDALLVLGAPREENAPDDDLVAAEDELLAAYLARTGTALAAAAMHQEQAALGTVLQDSLAAPRLPDTPGIVWAATYRPARETLRVGGDFYEVVASGERPAFLLGDVCGKGIDAAVLSGRVRQSWHALRLVEDRPGALLPLLNTALLDAGAARDEGPRFATMVLGDAEAGDDGTVALRLATGGHLPPLVLRADGSVETLALAGMLVGGVREARFDEVEVLLRPGDTCLLYSDGIVEARGRRGEFGEDRLAAALTPCAGAPAAVVCEQLEQTVVSWLDGADHDDIAMLAIQAPR